MLSTYADIENDVVKKLGITTTAAYYTDAIIGAWINQAHRWATAFRKWPFTEGRYSTTFTGLEEWSIEGYKGDSVRMLLIGGKRHEKLNYEDYLIMREETPDANDRVFSDFGRLVIVNPNTDASGTMVAYGQYTPADLDITGGSSVSTVFSYGDEEGNEAIVEKVLEFAYTKEKKEKDALTHGAKAAAILDALWKKFEDEQFKYKTHKTRDGMFKRFNVIEGDINQYNRDQFPLG